MLAEAKRERADTLTEVQDMIEEEKNTILIQVKQPFFSFSIQTSFIVDILSAACFLTFQQKMESREEEAGTKESAEQCESEEVGNACSNKLVGSAASIIKPGSTCSNKLVGSASSIKLGSIRATDPEERSDTTLAL